jgi:flagellar hook-associated protein 2
MGISSVGVGSSILTQDILDQLREADEAAQIRPIDFNIALEKDKKAAFSTLDAHMTNLVDSINELKMASLFDDRTTSVTGTSVEVSADPNSDLQEFTLDVTQLATKQIEESGSYTSATDSVASADGTMTLNVGDKSFSIDYTADMTLTDLKNSINDVAGDSVSATIVQISEGDYRLFLNSVDTGSNQDISISDDSGNLSGTQLTDDLTAVQDGVDAEFTFNGQAITRHSNKIDDLITGYDITLKELGKSEVKVEQNREAIMEKIDSFIEKYNAAATELANLTKNSTNADERGIFATESSIKGLQSTLRDMIESVGGGVGNLYEYGFDMDKKGQLSIDKDVFNKKLDENSSNVEAFFSGGDFEKSDGTVVQIDGAFGEMFNIVDSYTGFNGELDNFKGFLDDRLSSLEESKTKAIERLDSKYNTLKKQFIAYDAMIAKLNNASNMFIEMANTQNSTQNQ